MYSKQIIEQLALSRQPMDAIEMRLETHLVEVFSEALNANVPVSILKCGNDPKDVYVHLDGGVGDRETLLKRKALIAMMMEAGVISPDSMHVSFSGGSGAFYTGGWESWVAEELPQWLSEQFNVAVHRENLVLSGISAGGHGALKIAFRQPNRFRAVVALEPVIMPSLVWPDQHTRASWWMVEASARAVWGEPFPESFLASHPPNVLVSNAEDIRDSGLDIYLEVGDEDLLNLQDGAEFLHRLLWQHDVPHEFHQVRWADHGGHSIEDRFIEAMCFLDASLNGRKKQARTLDLSDAEQRFVDYVLGGGPMRGEPVPEGASPGSVETELSVMARLWEPLRSIAVSKDPNMKRHYGSLPELKK